jgi:hypothetical protein
MASLVEFCMKAFPRVSFNIMELVASEYFIAVVTAMHTITTMVSHNGERLFNNIKAFNSSLIVIPCVESSYSLR